jgi:hypothetical protein
MSLCKKKIPHLAREDINQKSFIYTSSLFTHFPSTGCLVLFHEMLTNHVLWPLQPEMVHHTPNNFVAYISTTH